MITMIDRDRYLSENTLVALKHSYCSPCEKIMQESDAPIAETLSSLEIDKEDEMDSIFSSAFKNKKPTAQPRRSLLSADCEYYDMTNEKRGIALILNHYQFKSMKPRPGTLQDRDRVSKCFKSLDFEVHVENDLKYGDVKKVLERFSKIDHTENDCLVVIIMTHGEKGVLWAQDKKYPVEELWEPFIGDKGKSLVGKPKLFFVQACRGEKLDKPVQFRAVKLDSTDAITETVTYSIPTMADLLIMYSTYDGHYSWRNPDNGSWFIQALCAELNENGRVKDLLTLLTGVSRRVAYEYQSNVPGNEKFDAMKQMPSIVSMLTKILYFTKKIQSSK